MKKDEDGKWYEVYKKRWRQLLEDFMERKVGTSSSVAVIEVSKLNFFSTGINWDETKVEDYDIGASKYKSFGMNL